MDIDRHQLECDFELLTCPNAIPDCEPFLRKDTPIHENRCRFYPCKYATEGCPFLGTFIEVKVHCDQYCGKLHHKLQHLQEECNRLKKLLSHHNIRHDSNVMQYSPPNEAKQSARKASSDSHMMTLTNTDLLSMFDDTFFPLGLEGNPQFGDNMGSLLEKSNSNYCADVPASIFPAASTTTPAVLSNPATALPLPKRSSNGKIIRYSKNVRMAHNALRMARQKATFDDPEYADMDEILQDFDLFKSAALRDRATDGDISMTSSAMPSLVSIDSPTSIELANLMSQQTLSSQSSAASPPPILPFSNLDDVTKFLAACPSGMDHTIGKPTSPLVGQLAIGGGGKLTSSPLAPPAREFTPTLARLQTNKQKTDSHSSIGSSRAKKNTTGKKKDSLARTSQTPNTTSHMNSSAATTTTTTTATTTNTTTTSTSTTNRPMFVLASSYLTNYK
ncbi:hypothetical protein DFQ30_005765 [Apophysomyces sp. BC1015]|nr:hypothetical protein DFQ30_005765 [Apophysomyces sp. BC1015]